MDDSFVLESVDDLDQIQVPQRFPRIERVPWHRIVKGDVLCDRLFKLPTHFVGTRSQLCPGRAKCGHCKKLRLCVYFLCAVYDAEAREAIWYQLTPPAAKLLLLGVKTLGRPLFGAQVQISRKWKDKNAPVILAVDNYAMSRVSMHRPLTPEESVKRCFFSTFEKASRKPRKAV